ncbi:MAG: hypothetical protein JWP36_1074 [Paucimonas sp.]|nr:hypothetical protein [Paucimonas sp.]
MDRITRLVDAMESNHLQLHYQPIATVNCDDSGFRCEVLLRLVDPEHGVMLPSAFFLQPSSTT